MKMIGLIIVEVVILINFASMINDDTLSLAYIIMAGILCEAWNVFVESKSTK